MASARLLRVSDETIREAARTVSGGGLVAYPTDTVYGLGCDPFNAEAVRRLILVKERQKVSLPVLVDSFETAARLGRLDPPADRIADVFWPGPLTLVVPARETFPLEVAPSGLVGLRVPKRAETIMLAHEIGGCIVGTSANLSGRESSRSADDVVRMLGDRIEVILDGGPTNASLESTVLQVSERHVSMLREAAISMETIESRCPSVFFS